MHVEDADDGGSGPCHFPRYVISSTNCGGPGYAFNRSDVAIELFPTSEWLHGVVLAGICTEQAAESAVTCRCLNAKPQWGVDGRRE